MKGAVSNIAGMQLAPAGRGAGKAERGTVQLVSGEYSELLRQRPQRGRLLTHTDNVTIGAHPVVVISDAYWRRQLSASENAVGASLTINGAVFTIVGIAERQFFGTTLTVRSPDVWIPLVMQPVVRYAQNASSHDGAGTRQPWPSQSLLLVFLGAALGVPLAISLGIACERCSLTIPPLDPIAYGTGALLLVAVSVLAAFLPARRASRIDPMVALYRS